jgi:radical SAM protein with 4Fe4S-binding SPASM domain
MKNFEIKNICQKSFHMLSKFISRTRKAILLIVKRPKGFTYYCLNLFSALIKSTRAFGLPVSITIEPTNLCNLHCPVCETGAGLLKRTQGVMGLDNFKKIIDKIHRHTNYILFYFVGEPFVNRESYQMIKYAKSKGIFVTTCTNGHFVDARQLIESEIDEISFQIGGVTEDSHQKYRVGSCLKDIIENAIELVNRRAALNRRRPKIILGLILMKQNELEINAFYRLANSIGVDEARIYEPCVLTWEQGKLFLPENRKYWLYDVDAFERGILKPKRIPHNRCNWMYFSTVILYNGDVVPCCRDAQGKHTMGNVLKEEMHSIWNNRKYMQFRETVKKEQNKLEICKLCSDFGIPNLYISKR